MREIDVKHNWTLDDSDWPLLRSPAYNGVIHISNTQDKWEVGLDAIAFRPNEVKVSIRPNDRGRHELLVEGIHDHRDDEHGSIAREIHRTIHIPDDVDTNTIIANLFPNGLLNVKADKMTTA